MAEREARGVDEDRLQGKREHADSEHNRKYSWIPGDGDGAKASKERAKAERADLRKRKSGCVYVIAHDEMPNIVKIGMSSHPYKRARELSVWTCVPGDYKLVGYIFAEKKWDMEKLVHKHLEAHRKVKEFFSLKPNDALDELAKFGDVVVASEEDEMKWDTMWSKS